MKRLADPIYVESLIKADVEEIWRRTQHPEVHQRWDVRFSTITYFDRADDEPQRFVYGTRVAPGLRIDGRGETLGERHRPDGTAYSGLRFWCDHPLSLIREGAGFWRYVPTADGVRFLTRYDYRPRWGAVGRLIDRMLFRPIFGWATAWSFDRLRLWIEQDIEPERSRNRMLTHLVAVATLTVIVLHHVVGPLITPLVGGAPSDGGWIAVRPPTPLTIAVGAVTVAAIVRQRRAGLPSGRRPLRTPPSTINEEVPQ